MVDGRLSLAPVMSKKELRKGFAISAAVPFVKAGTLKASKNECFVCENLTRNGRVLGFKGRSPMPTQ